DLHGPRLGTCVVPGSLGVAPGGLSWAVSHSSPIASLGWLLWRRECARPRPSGRGRARVGDHLGGASVSGADTFLAPCSLAPSGCRGKRSRFLGSPEGVNACSIRAHYCQPYGI